MVKIRLSERFTKETIKRVQKKFTFYAECEFLRPLGQTYLSKSEREYLRNEVSEIRISERKNKRILIFLNRQQTESNQTCLNCRGAEEEDDSQREYLRNLASEYEKRAKLGGLSGIK